MVRFPRCRVHTSREVHLARSIRPRHHEFALHSRAAEEWSRRPWASSGRRAEEPQRVEAAARGLQRAHHLHRSLARCGRKDRSLTIRSRLSSAQRIAPMRHRSRASRVRPTRSPTWSGSGIRCCPEPVCAPASSAQSLSYRIGPVGVGLCIILCEVRATTCRILLSAPEGRRGLDIWRALRAHQRLRARVPAATGSFAPEAECVESGARAQILTASGKVG